jgi:hypothetical protein
MRKLLVLLIAALTLGVCAAAASACDEAPPSGTFCVDGQTVNATGYEYYLLTFEQELYSDFEIADTSISSGACAVPVMLPHTEASAVTGNVAGGDNVGSYTWSATTRARGPANTSRTTARS